MDSENVDRIHLNFHGTAASISLYEVALALLVFLDRISRLKAWDSESWASTFVDVVQLGIYILLFVLLIKNHYSFEMLFAIGLSLILLIAGYFVTREAVFIRDLLLLVAAKDISFNKILKSLRYSLSLVMLIAVLSVLFGFADMAVQRRGGLALGFSHPNQAALVLTIILLLWLAEKHKTFKSSDFVFALIATTIIYIVTKSRTPLALAVLVVVVGIIYKNYPSLKIGKGLIKVLIVMPILCLAFTVVTAYLLPMNSIVNRLDLLLSNRIFLNWYAINHHGMRLFGQIVNLTEGSGTTFNEIRGIWSSLITVDNSYTLALVSLGIIPTFVFVGWSCFSQKQIVVKGDLFLLILGTVFCIYGITEAQMIDVFNNFMLLFAMASVSEDSSRSSSYSFDPSIELASERSFIDESR